MALEQQNIPLTARFGVLGFRGKGLRILGFRVSGLWKFYVGLPYHKTLGLATLAVLKEHFV